MGSGASGGPGSINGTSGVLDNGFLAFDSSTSVTSFAHNISGSGGVGQMSNGKALRLDGTNTYAGPTLINAGILQSGNASYGFLPSTTSVTIASGGVYWVVGTQTVASLCDVGSSSGKVVCSSASTATLTLAPSAGDDDLQRHHVNSSRTAARWRWSWPALERRSLAGNNTYGGGTTIQSGVLSVSNDYNLGASSGTLSISGGTLQASSGFTLSASAAHQRRGRWGINVPTGTLIYGGRAPWRGSATGNLTKTGAGILQFDGPSRLTGTVSVNAGACPAPARWPAAGGQRPRGGRPGRQYAPAISAAPAP